MSLPMLLGIALAIGLLVWSGVLLLQAWVNTRLAREQDRKIVAPPFAELEVYQAEQQALLGEYRWIDREAGRVGLPVERAMQLVVEEHATPSGARTGGEE
jgi:hypothetical protein